MAASERTGTSGMATPAQPTLHSLTAGECYQLLSAGQIGRVVFNTADGPVALPVNYAMVGQVVVLRTAVDTELVARLDCPVSFEADRFDPTLHQGWSVLVTGRATRVTSERQVRRLEARTSLLPWADGARDVFVQITPHRITGRRLCR